MIAPAYPGPTGPAGDVGIGALARAVRLAYGTGLLDVDDLDVDLTGYPEAVVEALGPDTLAQVHTFAAFLAGAGAPAAPPDR